MKIYIAIPDSLEHYLITKIVYIHEYNLETGEHKIIKEPTEGHCLVVDKKIFDTHYPNLNSRDLLLNYWLITNKAFHWQDYYSIFLKHYRSYKQPLKYIPQLKHKEICTCIIEDLLAINGITEPIAAEIFYYDNVYPSIMAIEKAGLKVDLNLFNQSFNKAYEDDIVYCNYNLFTTTGRPSNAFDHVNYAALKKDNDERKCFISRFPEGQLVEFDFDSYHLRLIAQILDYKLPGDNIYLHFGQQIYHKDIQTEEDYTEVKNLTFKILYSNASEQYTDYEFFGLVDYFKTKLWQQMQNLHYVKSPFSSRILKEENFTDLSKSKLFNYMLQMIETEYSMHSIQKILELLKGKRSKLILYTYDSFLLDYCPEDSQNLLESIKSILGRASIKAGKNYKDMLSFEFFKHIYR